MKLRHILNLAEGYASQSLVSFGDNYVFVTRRNMMLELEYVNNKPYKLSIRHTDYRHSIGLYSISMIRYDVNKQELIVNGVVRDSPQMNEIANRIISKLNHKRNLKLLEVLIND